MSTISDVARRAGVSAGTVSRVINGAGNVTPAIRARVEQAIAELGYFPNAAARTLRSKRSHWLALVVPTILRPHWHDVARGVEDAALNHGYAVLLCNTDDNPARQRRYLEVAAQQNVAGVIVCPSEVDARGLTPLRDRGIATVIVNRRIPGWDGDMVCCDSLSSARSLMQHLIGLGHQQIAILTGPLRLSTMRDRVAGYCLALADAGIAVDPRLIRQGESTADSGQRLTQQMLDEGLRPTAILATTDGIARGVMDALAGRGLRIPHDMALVCFGDWQDPYFPFLTCIVESAYEIGTNAAQLLFSRLDAAGTMPPRQVVLPSRLVVRYSCGSHRGDPDGGPVLAFPRPAQTHSQLLRPLDLGEQDRLCIHTLEGSGLASPDGEPVALDRSDAGRLLKVLRYQEADRLPYLELEISDRRTHEQILLRSLEPWLDRGGKILGPVRPEDQVELARRLGMDLVVCRLPQAPSEQSARGWGDLDHPEVLPSLAGQLGSLERCLDAARGTGVGVGVAVSVGSCLGDLRNGSQKDRRLPEALADALLERQEKTLCAACDRFGDGLALVVLRVILDRLDGPGQADLLGGLSVSRLRRLLAPAREHRRPVVLSADRPPDGSLFPLIYEAGISAVHPISNDVEEAVALKARWAGRLAFIGGFPGELLRQGTPQEIEDRVGELCARLASGGGYVLGASAPIDESVPPANLWALARAVRRHGRYTSSTVGAAPAEGGVRP